jgi:prepilin-type N-terminal cleavage/methylation domain-containing protein
MKGFTLIEVLISLAILSISLLGLWSLHISATHSNVLSQRMSEATSLADQKIEELRAADFNLLACGQDTPQFLIYTYRREWEVIDAVAPNTKQVTVTVGWGGSDCLEDVNNCDHRVEVVTFITQLD